MSLHAVFNRTQGERLPEGIKFDRYHVEKNVSGRNHLSYSDANQVFPFCRKKSDIMIFRNNFNISWDTNTRSEQVGNLSLTPKGFSKTINYSSCRMGYFMNNDSTTIVASQRAHFLSYYYWMEKIQYARRQLSPTDNRTLPFDKPKQRLMYGPVLSNNYQVKSLLMYLVMLCICQAILLLFPMLSIVINVINEKKFIQPYFKAIGLPNWLFFTQHFISGLIRSLLPTIITIGIMCVVGDKFSFLLVIFINILYVLGATSFAILCATIFKSPKFGVLMVIVLWLAPAVFKLFNDHDHYIVQGTSTMNRVLSFCFNFNINYAYQSCYDHFATITATGKEYSIGDISMITIDGYPITVYISFMIFDTVFMAFLAILWDDLWEVISFDMIFRLFSSSDKLGKTANNDEGKALLEEEVRKRDDKNIGIELKNVWKVFYPRYVALNNVTLEAVKGQITLLLGANGSGKSTIFSLISGMIRPTKGWVKVNGGMDSDTCNIGYCPQYDPLYDGLTVMQHLELVYVLKSRLSVGYQLSVDNIEGESMDDEDEARELLKQVKLADKEWDCARELSGGMRRKLCVCMALIGGSEVVLLDEPTGGMDVVARNDVQMMLLREKHQRTILLTTHYMDEAANVGDWAYVLSGGQVATTGSIPFLKSKYYDGFMLNVVIGGDNIRQSVESVALLCYDYCQQSTLKSVKGNQIEMFFPNSVRSTFADFLHVLECLMNKDMADNSIVKLPQMIKDKLSTCSIITFGLSDTTLEQVLLAICKKNDKMSTDMMDKNYEAFAMKKMKDEKRGYKPFVSLLYKRLLWTWRNKWTIVPVFIIPLILLVVCFDCMESIRTSNGFESFDSVESTNVNIYSLNKFPESDVYIKGLKIPKIEEYLAKFPHLNVINVQNDKKMIDILIESKWNKRVFGFLMDIKSKDIDIIFSPSIRYYEGDKKKILTNSLVNLLYLESESFGKHELRTLDHEHRYHGGSEVTRTYIQAVFSLFQLSFIVMLLPTLIHQAEENTSQFKHLQQLTSINSFTFWFCNFLYDFGCWLILMLMTITYLLIFQNLQMSFIIVLLKYALGAFLSILIPVYMIPKLIKSTMFCLIFFLTIHFVLMIFPTVCLFFSYAISLNIEQWAFAFPIVLLMNVFMKVLMSNPINDRQKRQFQKIIAKDFKGDESVETIGFFIILIIYLIGFIVFNSKTLKVFVYYTIFKKKDPKESTNEKHLSCIPVKKEQEYIDKSDGHPDGCVVVVNKLVQNFGEFYAVNGVSFTVKQSECFGLLGANGSGKTTTFDILTGKRLSSGGSVHIDKNDINSDNVEIGFCPQFDATMGHLTGIECLKMFAGLNCYEDIKEVVQILLECIGMTEHRNKLIRQLSGGQRRRISLGVAILSRSHCIILDEPTTGIDPIARRELWDVLDNIRKKSDCSIILTSHSMDECEALCGRIAVLQHGELIAIGTSQELMTEHGEYYNVVFTIEQQGQRVDMIKRMKDKWKDMMLIRKGNGNEIYVKIPRSNKDKWSTRYQEMMAFARDNKLVTFMMTQSTLEDAIMKLTEVPKNRTSS